MQCYFVFDVLQMLSTFAADRGGSDGCLSLSPASLSRSLFSDDPALTNWVGNLGLTMADQDTLSSGKLLSANHISAASKLLRASFPTQNGLQDTHYLLEKLQWDSSPNKFVQIIYVDPGHWACLSNKFPGEEIDLYDSMHTIPTQQGTIVRQACRIAQSQNSSITINVIDVQPQFGGADCGLFAIAMASDLCRGIDPFDVKYCQDEMRKHLENCIKKQSMTQFPSSIRRGIQRRIVKSLHMDIHCLCRQPEHPPMVCCDCCDKWYHSGCVEVPDNVFEVEEILWLCPSCKLSLSQS